MRRPLEIFDPAAFERYGMAQVSKKRVCCFCETWKSGGIESFLYNILSRMDFSKIEVDIVASELRESVFTEPLRARGVRFLSFPAASAASRPIAACSGRC